MARRNTLLSLAVFAFKTTCIALMFATPLIGVWVASSMAAFANRATWLPVAAGLLLFPGLPLLWEGSAVLRTRSKPARKAFLTFSDRLVIRTLAINVIFLGGLLALFPTRAFVALSTRGDWMLDGRHGETTSRARRALLASAGALEWVYRAAHDNPYRRTNGEAQKAADNVHPTAAPTSTGAAAPIASASSTTAPATSSATTTSSATRYPLPATLHPAVVAMPPEAEQSIASVGKYILDHERDPMLRVKALHDYVTDRVAYDVPAYLAHDIPAEDGDAEAVFRSHKAVCAGYADLLAALGKVTGDEILYIVGDARSQRSPMEGEGHAWNAAKIDGAWYLLDATWNAGYPQGAAFVKKYGTTYLFTPPEQFAISHFPDAPKWQLLEHPLTRAAFFRQPVLAPAFFASGLTLNAPDRSQVTVSDYLYLSIGNPHGVLLIADYERKDGGGRTECSGDQHANIRCDFTAAGTYDVRMFVNEGRAGTYAFAGSVEVNARP